MFRFLVLLIAPLLFLACSQSEEPTDQTGQNQKVEDQLSEEAGDQKPNIIVIMTDDMGFECLGAYGCTEYKTPNLDRMAKGGMLFSQAYSTPLCTPSRVQLMTGLYNNRNYIGFGMLDSTAQTFAHDLKNAGYTTGITGKWQLYGMPDQQERASTVGTTPAKAGFDDWLLWQIKLRKKRFKDPTLESKKDGVKEYLGSYGPDLFNDFALDFITKNQDKPFFLYYPMILVHNPFQPTPDHADYADFPSDDKVSDTTYFKTMVEYTDHLVGRIVDSVAALGMADNTMILFFGDNGTNRKIETMTQNGAIWGNKGGTNEYGNHVPFIAYWPGKTKNGVSDQMLDFTDIRATVAKVAGAKHSAEGYDLSPTIFEGKPSGREWVFCSYHPNWGSFEPADYIQDKQFKLYSDGRFYDRKADPKETSPLQTEGNMPLAATKESLQKKLDSLMTPLSR